ncbi:lipoprotein N-acyltransferase Lnb domain-containing protein [Psychrobacter sp. I-STPA10]|uniref:lipoprotein N-acyltransferase Lnb domain-containing protein n=1 Tax=Psychrobacter sp. I-STPA10 TaxID=2585769 RepID=UPI001E55B77E|nr:DUF4105 domain-containing protein [Psychrobacter sp. I-STPA10]
MPNNSNKEHDGLPDILPITYMHFIASKRLNKKHTSIISGVLFLSCCLLVATQPVHAAPIPSAMSSNMASNQVMTAPLPTKQKTSSQKTNSQAMSNQVQTHYSDAQPPFEISTIVDSETTLQTLANHRQWQHLLFYKNHQPEVISADFYLSAPTAQSRQNFSPYQELIATLKNSTNPEVVCRFPARYFWLSHHLPKLSIDLDACPQLPKTSEKMSVILVSSYLKNPASTFGHVLIKTHDHIDVDSDDNAASFATSEHQLSSNDLLNNSYNFGARIPENENGVMYAIKGLFGWYDAGFSESEFFKQDAVYSKTEQRDMWEYVLNLDEFNTQLLNYHLYEAKSARFDYYFIKQNCGYRSGELLELVSDIKTTQRTSPWYAPDFVFDQLVEYSDDKGEPLIESVRYLPSEQTQLRQQFVQLEKPLQTVINDFIRHEDISVLETLNPEKQALALEFLISHRNYKLSQDDNEHDHAIKKQLLSKRFMLPAGKRLSNLALQDKPSPALSNKTSQAHVSLGTNDSQLGVALFVKDPLNTYTDIDKRFKAVQLSVRYDYDKDKPEFDEFVFLDMQQIENMAQPLAGEPKMSWQLQTGVKPDLFEPDKHSVYAQAGVGVGAKSGEYLLGYGMVNASIHDQDSHLDTSVELGLRIKNPKQQKQSAQLSYTATKRASHEIVQQAQLTLRQQINKNNDIRLVADYIHQDSQDNHQNINNQHSSSDKDNALSVVWHHYW